MHNGIEAIGNGYSPTRAQSPLWARATIFCLVPTLLRGNALNKSVAINVNPWQKINIIIYLRKSVSSLSSLYVKMQVCIRV